MATRSAGILLWRPRDGGAGPPDVEVLLVHPGGPLWATKDDGAWSLAKGELDEGDDPAAAAAREFAEELGGSAPTDGWQPLGQVRQAGGKVVVAWAVPGDFDPSAVVSNHFEMEWPPRSGRRASFPEVDRAGWFDLAAARVKLLESQRPFLDRLAELLAV
ncbi:MAG TPA: NUDIX domain-containing protein [Acidimicrobiales bacterium]|nr:NUDIX domain-containing protein [Acidimicrobiales bacterium]